MIDGPQKILRLPADYDKLLAIPGTNVGSGDFHRQSLIIFHKSGYKLIPGGDFDATNPHEIGYYLPALKDEDGNAFRRLANIVGAKTPYRFEISDILNSPKPVMAKATFLDAGFGKLLLKTTNQKLKFIAWASLQGDPTYHSAKWDLANKKLKSALNAFSKGKTPLINPENLWGWQFEEFIETPSQFYTSFRIVVDAHGQIHYANLIHSDQPKIQAPEVQNWQAYLVNRDRVEERIKVQEIAKLVHPESPVYLAARQVVSNSIQGGHRLLLNGKKVDDPRLRQMLEDHVINPDMPLPPQGMMEMASKTGIANRQHAPYTGWDGLLDAEFYQYFIEANSGPMLSAIGLGLSEETTEEERHLVLTRRVAQFLR